METLCLKTVKITPKLLSFLEEKKLVRTLTPTPKILETRTRTGAVDTFYTSVREFGTHKLIGIGKRSTEIKLSWHGDNEEFILINTTNLKYKPLYLIVALHKNNVIEHKIAAGTLSADDFLALELEYNKPKTCIFSLLKGTVHCEVTLPGEGQHPVFFVSEPAELKMNYIKTKKYGFVLDKQSKIR